MQQQCWVANLAHYSRLSDYLAPEESKRHCQDLLDFLTQDISRGHDMLFIPNMKFIFVLPFES